MPDAPEPLVAFADLEVEPLVAAALAAHADPAARPALERLLFCEPGGTARAVARRVLASDGPFARAAAAGIVDPARRAVAAAELDLLGSIAHGRLGVRFAGAAPDRDGPQAALLDALDGGRDWSRHLEVLEGHFRTVAGR